MAGPSRTVRFFDADFETSVQKWLDEADSDVDDIRKDEDELVSEHDSRSEQSADSDCNENPEDDVAELCDRDYDVAEDECAGNNVAETDSEQFGLRNIPLSEKENNNSPNSGTDDDIPLSELLARLNSKKKYYYGGKRCFKWSKVPPSARVRHAAHNIVVSQKGLRGRAIQMGNNPDHIDVWHLIFTDDMKNEILCWTNQKIRASRMNFSEPNRPYMLWME
ncbi:hypothetical protein JTB14_014125 [Gonioctena quinquepunctata]|nr:hypothetical protein JTB14_014125 [Gonioctena quinquepunctata]